MKLYIYPYRKYQSLKTCSSDVTGLVHLLVGWLEKLQNRNWLGALISLLQLVLEVSD